MSWWEFRPGKKYSAPPPPLKFPADTLLAPQAASSSGRTPPPPSWDFQKKKKKKTSPLLALECPFPSPEQRKIKNIRNVHQDLMDIQTFLWLQWCTEVISSKDMPTMAFWNFCTLRVFLFLVSSTLPFLFILLHACASTTRLVIFLFPSHPHPPPPRQTLPGRPTPENLISVHFSGVAPANQTKERSVHELFAGAFRNKSSI